MQPFVKRNRTQEQVCPCGSIIILALRSMFSYSRFEHPHKIYVRLSFFLNKYIKLFSMSPYRLNLFSSSLCWFFDSLTYVHMCLQRLQLLKYIFIGT